MSTFRILVIGSFILSFIGFTNQKAYAGHMQQLLDSHKPSYHHSKFPKVGQEVLTPVALQPVGHLPSWLEGQFLQNGPGKFAIGNQQLTHF